jgi:hypothetical protein
MPSREEALRKILAASGRFTEEQRRELVTHLEDSVQAKVAAGTSELDAVARALEELGDLRKLARRFPAPAAPVTPEGWLWRTWSLESGYLLLLTFVALVAFVAPPLQRVFDVYRVPLPRYSAFFLDVGAGFRAHWPLAVPVLLAVGWAFLALCRTRVRRSVGLAFSILATALCAAAVAALALPFLTLLDGVARRPPP